MPDIARTALAGLARAGLAGALALSSAVLVGTVALAPSEAHAQGFFNFWDAPPPPRRIKRPRPVTMPDDEIADAEPSKPTAGPLVVNVSIKRQRVSIYDANGLVTEAPVSSGRVGYATPTGVFSILEKNRVHFSNLYDSAPMPNMQRLTWSGVALHAGALPGYPASHGCVRLPPGFSKKLFGMTALGTRVIVSRDPAPPVAIEHEHLFGAYPPDEVLSTASIRTEPDAEKSAEGTRVVDASNQMVGPEAPANVAAVESAPLTPAEARKAAYRQHRMAVFGELSAAVREAGYRKLEMSTRIAEVSKVATAARASLGVAKAEAERTARIARKAASAKKDAEEQFAKFAKKLQSAHKMTADQVQKAPSKWDELEARAKALAAAADVAAKLAAEADQAAKSVEPAAIEAEAQRRAVVNGFSKASADLAAAVNAEEAAKRREAKRALPVSVFISRATQRLYVRQGYEPILDVPVTFNQADQPVGTHVFTALDYKPSKTDLVWSVSSTGYVAPTQAQLEKKKRKDAAATPTAPVVDRSLQTASAALDRIAIPDDVRDQIVDVIKPGSSLIISDHGISNETGKFTDFIVLTR